MAVIDLADQWESVSDASLVEQAQDGRLDAFTALYERHHRGILRHCRARLGNDHDAADAAQETFLRAWRALEGFGGERRVGPWLRTIASNVCLDALRFRNRAVPVATFDATVEPAADIPPDTAAVTAALARLSDRHREILQLREFQGLSYERIAEHQQLDLNAVKSLLWRARQSLRREFLLVTAQGRLSVLGGLLLVRPAARLRALLSDASSAVAQAGVAGGTAATAVVMTATVALPALATSEPPPPPPSPVVVAAEAAEAVVVPASSFRVTRAVGSIPGPVLAAAAAAPAETEEPTEGQVPTAAPEAEQVAKSRPADKAEREEVAAERKERQTEAKAGREDERAEARADRADAKADRAETRAEKAEKIEPEERANAEPPGPVTGGPGSAGDAAAGAEVEPGAPGHSGDGPASTRPAPIEGATGTPTPRLPGHD